MYSGRNGCCITFSHEITKPTEGDRVALAPVIYEREKQEQHLEILNDQRRKPEYREQDRYSANLHFLLNTVFLKSPAWIQEREWRIVKIIQEESFADINYRSGSRFLKPYVSISRKPEPLPITQIMAGPADDQDRLLHSIEHLTKMTKGYEDVEVSRSSIRLSPS